MQREGQVFLVPLLTKLRQERFTIKFHQLEQSDGAPLAYGDPV